MTEPSPSPNTSRLVQTVSVVLLLLGFAVSAYLTHLHVQVHGPGADSVQSFCQLSKEVDCVTVAKSKYSSFLGIPIAVYGLEYFSAGLLLMALSKISKTFRRWDSVLFDLSAMSVPFFVVLGWISTVKIHSVCILCLFVYGINIVMALFLGIAGRRNMGNLVKDGPRQLLSLWKPGESGGARALAMIAFTFGLTQFAWLPRVFAYGQDTDAGNNMNITDDGGQPGTFLDLPAHGLSLGPKDAPIQIAEYTDFQCPFCSRAHHVMLRVVKTFPGKIRLTHHDYPLDNKCNRALNRRFHPHACAAALRARCAASQGRYWPYEGRLFAGQQHLGPALYQQAAKATGLDIDKFNACVASKKPMESIKADIEFGIDHQIRGTPTFFINGKEKVVGAKPMSFWDKKIRTLLAH